MSLRVSSCKQTSTGSTAGSWGWKHTAEESRQNLWSDGQKSRRSTHARRVPRRQQSRSANSPSVESRRRLSCWSTHWCVSTTTFKIKLLCSFLSLDLPRAFVPSDGNNLSSLLIQEPITMPLIVQKLTNTNPFYDSLLFIPPPSSNKR